LGFQSGNLINLDMLVIIMSSNNIVIDDPKFWKHVVENSLVGVFIVDENLRIKYVNKIVETFTGYSKDEIYRMSVFKLAPEDEREIIVNKYMRGLRGEKVFMENRYITKDGKERWVWGFVIPVEINGELVGVGNWIDITANKMLQAKLKQSEEFHRSLIEESVAPVAILQDGVFVYANKAFEDISEYTRQELKGMSPFEFFIHPDDRDAVLEKYLKLVSGESDVESQEFRVISKSGREIYASVTGSRITLNGRPAVAITAIDITGLKKSEEFHRSLIEKSLAPIHIVQKGEIVYANESFEKVTGFKKEELLGMGSFGELIHPNDRDFVLKNYHEVELGIRDAEDINFRLITRNGGVKWMTVRLVRIDYEGKSAVASTGMDTTKIHTLTDELKKKSEHLSLLNKMLRHDILNDLTVIRAAIELKDEKLLETALSKIDRISRMIYEAKNLEMVGDVRKEINLAEVVREIASTFREMAEITLNLQNVNVIANEGIKTVVFNLINNAIKHSGRDDVKIDVETYAKEGWGVLVVRDNGKGIPDELKEKIFDEGFSAGSGTGMGLSIVKKMVELYGGSVEVRDNEPSGAVFIVKLPESFREQCA
jgi:PAS domain S-box-containing protein